MLVTLYDKTLLVIVQVVGKNLPALPCSAQVILQSAYAYAEVAFQDAHQNGDLDLGSHVSSIPPQSWCK